MLTLGVALAALPVKADRNLGFDPEEYERIFRGQREGLDVHDPMFWLLAGMIAGLREANADYVGTGRKPLFCMTGDFQPTQMRDLILDELAKDGGRWRRVLGATAERIALGALRREYPCR